MAATLEKTPGQTAPLKQVVLHDAHLALGGRMVPFAGYSLPVQYAEGIMAEHKWTRAHAGLFDVSHMGPAFLELTAPSGDPDPDFAALAALIEPLVCGDIAGLRPGAMRYTLLLNAEGGIRDDLIVARASAGDRLYLVVNAGCKEDDFALIAKAAGEAARLQRADSGALLALQGPEAAGVLDGLVPGVAMLAFMSCGTFSWRNTELAISRSGYTGEDGFEILVPADNAAALWEELLADERVKPVGLGARDSLRLEAGLPLYGHDLDETTSPIEADLGFAVSKSRRERADFPGAARILAEREQGPRRIRIGLSVEGAPAREGADILDMDERVIGTVTSGGFSPTLGRAIALGFVPPDKARPGLKLAVRVRNRIQPAEVTPLPFVPHRYVRNPRPEKVSA